ncbi:MAG: LysM peptidoglycan-binding domain-containing protein [Planctomycetota bacterium]
MNELSKLISSLLLLAAGFVAASFVGPPELITKLSNYLHPEPRLPADGLRPLAMNQSRPSTDGWPALERQAAPASTVSASLHAEQPEATPPASPWGATAPVAAMVPPSTWDAPNDPAAEPPAANDQGDWLTASDFTAPPRRETTPSVGQLTPIERGTPTQTAPDANTDADQTAAWPELRAPRPPVDLLETRADTERGLRRLPPTSPYGERPRFDATSAIDTPSNPLRADDSVEPIAPIGRQPAKATYTKHVVTDGDTLASLAERYLGEASRASELFELNRDRLENPDLLPIGMVLLTPDTARRNAAYPPTSADAFPALRPQSSDFATVSTQSSVLSSLRSSERRQLTPIEATAERPLTEAQRLGPVDPYYEHEVSWDANRW